MAYFEDLIACMVLMLWLYSAVLLMCKVIESSVLVCSHAFHRLRLRISRVRAF